MKVTAFIRKTSAKNNVTDLARVYFRVRDIGGVDIKAASELSINPNHWCPERQGYKPRVALVSEEKKNAFDRDIQQITHLITREYSRGVDGNWLKGLIEEYHHPNINARGGNKAEEYLLSYQIQKYVDETSLAFESRKHHLDNLNKVLRYERFRHEVMHQRGFHLCIDSITAEDIRDFKFWLQEEHKDVNMYPVFYRNEVRRMSSRYVPRTACREACTAFAPSSNGASSVALHEIILSTNTRSRSPCTVTRST